MTPLNRRGDIHVQTWWIAGLPFLTGWKAKCPQSRCLWIPVTNENIENFTERPSLPPCEPLGLEPIVYYQIFTLHRFFENTQLSDGQQQTNIRAVIQAYRPGSLRQDPNYVTIWWNGIQVERLKCDEEWDFDYDDALPRWKADHGDGKAWIERVQ